jgi:hypothetical protein
MLLSCKDHNNVRKFRLAPQFFDPFINEVIRTVKLAT